ncbi:MAG: hypothetical protein SGILL_010597, partial [Bacillariaceae sp.]
GLQDETEEPIEAMDIDFTMSYQSEEINVTYYEVMFQTWLNDNLNQVADDLRLLGLNVTSVEAASRITASSTAQTMPPTLNATATEPPIEFISDTSIGLDSPPTTAPTSAPSTSNSDGLATILSSMFVGACIVIAGLLVYWRKHRVGEDKFPRASSKHSIHNRKKRPTEEMSEDDVEQAKESASVGNDDDKKVRIKEPPSLRSSSKGSSIDEESPKKGEHFDDHFHYYFKKKNEKRERREKRKSAKEKNEKCNATDPSRRRSSSKPRRTSRDVSPPAPGESAEAIKARLKRLDELKDAMRP